MAHEFMFSFHTLFESSWKTRYDNSVVILDKWNILIGNQFMYLGFIIQKNKEIDSDVNYKIKMAYWNGKMQRESYTTVIFIKIAGKVLLDCY